MGLPGDTAAASDADLLALASELEVAATPYLAYDRDAEVTSADPDFAEATDKGRVLYRAVDGVAERIFAHEPQTLAGLLLTAHAAALTCSDTWDEHPDNGGKDGRLLRLVCNGLFRLVGVDWRGRAIPDARSPAGIDPDPELAAMVGAWQDLRDRIEGAEHTDEALADRKFALQRDILSRPCASLADLLAKLPLFREELSAAAPPPYGDPDDEDDMSVVALLGLVQDLEALSGRPRPITPARPAAKAAIAAAIDPAPAPSPDAALIPLAEAAIAEESRVTALCVAASDDLPPGSFARSMQLLELVSSFEAHTPAGLAAKARVLLEHIPEVDELEGDWRCEALALSIARDAVRLGAAG